MSEYHADNIIDLALELFGDDYTDAQLAEAEAVYFNNLPDGPYYGLAPPGILARRRQ